MKKIISIFLATLMVICCMSITAFAQDKDISSEAEAETTELYKDKYEEVYGYNLTLSTIYRELYYHYNDLGEIDYALIEAQDGWEPWNPFAIIGNHVLLGASSYPFNFGYAVYDVETNEFHSLVKPVYGGYIDLTGSEEFQKYEGLAEVVDEYVGGRLLGDIDRDDEISILDVTIIQRCEAEISEYPATDLIDPDNIITPYFDNVKLTYYSDFNRDKERDILDATCIQRYLADMPYTVG